MRSVAGSSVASRLLLVTAVLLGLLAMHGVSGLSSSTSAPLEMATTSNVSTPHSGQHEAMPDEHPPAHPSSARDTCIPYIASGALAGPTIPLSLSAVAPGGWAAADLGGHQVGLVSRSHPPGGEYTHLDLCVLRT